MEHMERMGGYCRARKINSFICNSRVGNERLSGHISCQNTINIYANRRFFFRSHCISKNRQASGGNELWPRGTPLYAYV